MASGRVGHWIAGWPCLGLVVAVTGACAGSEPSDSHLGADGADSDGAAYYTGAADFGGAPGSGGLAGSGDAIVDASGRTVRFDAPLRRVVSLVPSVTATLLELGAGDVLVGRTDYDTLPEVRSLPSVGGGIGPDLERLALLDPDLVVRFAGPSDERTGRRLAELNLAYLDVRPDQIADIFEIIEWLGHLTGRQAEAGALSRRLQAELDSVRTAVQMRSPVRAVYLMGQDPSWTAGAGTYIHELLELAGGVNVFADLAQLYGAVSPEALATRDIDVILLAPDARLDPRIAAGRRVYQLPHAIDLPGPQVAVAARTVASGLHPAVFPSDTASVASVR